jgi:type VI secretion system protein ImpA
MMGLPADVQSLDFTRLSLPLGEAEGGGQNFEYSAQFFELEEEGQGKPEVQYGDTLTQAIEPNWKRVMALALPMMEHSRDLRLAIWATRAQLNVHAFAGLASGLGLVEGLLKNCWDGLYPRLDPDDGYDPLLRINILAFLCAPDGLMHDVLDAPLISARGIGAVSLRLIDLVMSDPGGEGGQPSLAMIEGAFTDTDVQQLRAVQSALTQALAHSVQIEQWLTEKVGVGRAIDLSGLAAPLRRAAEIVSRFLLDPAPYEAAAATVATSAVVAPKPPYAEVRSREEARQVIDRLCSYFQTHEPASPVPYLLQRAKTLIDKNFIELLQDLAPDGLAQLAQVSGVHTRDN